MRCDQVRLESTDESIACTVSLGCVVQFALRNVVIVGLRIILTNTFSIA
jgi:hypothetical protein